MSDTSVGNESRKEVLKVLKAARKDQIAAATARMKEQRKAIKTIKEHLAGTKLTVPEIAAAANLPASEVLWYVATLKKYGEILEASKDGSYYRYKLCTPPAAETTPGPEE